jgi:hypothetical protein
MDIKSIPTLSMIRPSKINRNWSFGLKVNHPAPLFTIVFSEKNDLLFVSYVSNNNIDIKYTGIHYRPGGVA